MQTGYRDRPKWTYLMAIIFIVAPFVNFGFSFWLIGVHKWWDIFEWYTWSGKVILIDVVFLFLIFASGISLLLVRKWSWYITVAALSFTSLKTLFTIVFPNQLTNVPVNVIFTVITLGWALLFFLPKFKNVYLNPRTRWWETPQRFSAAMAKANVDVVNGGAELVDISKTGALLRVVDPELYMIGECYRLDLTESGLSSVIRVVRKHENNVGVEFFELNPIMEKRLMAWVDNSAKETR